jgi:hypothetical protein
MPYYTHLEEAARHRITLRLDDLPTFVGRYAFRST